MLADADAMPVKPNNTAISAMTRKMAAHRNIGCAPSARPFRIDNRMTRNRFPPRRAAAKIVLSPAG
jgi:hypothetical protein